MLRISNKAYSLSQRAIKKNGRELIRLHYDGLACIFTQLRAQTPRPKLATLVLVDSEVTEVKAFAFGSG